MANVLNSETENITLTTELETPTLEPPTENDQPSIESTSNPETEAVADPVDLAPTAAAEPKGAPESGDDFSLALAAFEREQAAEAAAVEAYGDKIVSGKVEKQTDKYLVVDVGLKSEGL